MKHRFLLLGFFLGCLAILPQLEAQNATTDKDKDKDKKVPEKSIDVTARWREMNSDKYQSPPTQFRPGHVNAKKLEDKATVKTENGFTIQLPSKAPIPTPTVYKGKLYVSGGFQSREYYCFNADTGKLDWGMNLDDDGPTSAVCDDDVVVFNTESCTIFALDAKTGKNLWSHFLGDPLTSSPTIANGLVYASYPANGGGGGFNAPAKGIKSKLKNILKDKSKGNLQKQQEPMELPKKANDAVEEKKEANPAAKHRPGASHVLACFELKTGKIVWQRWIDSDVMSAPVAVDDEIYATTFAGTVFKFKQNDGTIISAQHTRATSAPVVVGKNVYWTQRADHGKGEECAEEIAGLDRVKQTQNFAAAKRIAVYLNGKDQAKTKLNELGMKLDTANGFASGAPAAANPAAAYGNIGQNNVSTMQAFQGSRILHFRNANYNCMGDELVNTDPKDGKLRWKIKLLGDLAKLGGHLAAPPAVAGGQLFLATLGGELLLVDPDKGNVTKTYKVGSPLRSQPAIQNGRIYVGTQDGKIVCINTGDDRFTGWCTWGANMAHTNLVEAVKK